MRSSLLFCCCSDHSGKQNRSPSPKGSVVFGKKSMTRTGVLGGGSFQPSKHSCGSQQPHFQKNCLKQAGLKHTWILLQWSNCTAKAGGPALDACAGATDAAGAPTDWRNHLKHFVNVLVPLAVEAGGARAAGSSGPCVDESRKPKQHVTPCPRALRWQQGWGKSGTKCCP